MSDTLLIGRRSEQVLSIANALTAMGCRCERVDGGAAALRILRRKAFDIVVTDPETTIDEDLALLDELLEEHLNVKAILLAPVATPAEVIAALRARVYVCLTAPYDVTEIAKFAARSKTDPDWRVDIELLSARPEWVSLRANCGILTAERIVSFLDELHAHIPQASRRELMQGFRAVLLSSMETSKHMNEFKVVDVSAIRTERTLVFHVRDAISPFHVRKLAHAVAAGGETSTYPSLLGAKLDRYATLLANGVVDECINSELGNEVLLIKHTT
jgi:ActR/RegA family two-component response regulator